MSRADQFSLAAIKSGRIIVDAEAGTITRPSGKRAEQLDKRTAYGRVWVSTSPAIFAMAHRIVWVAEHGLIPNGLEINHLNGRRWDNRIANLELVTKAGNNRHAHGLGYDAVGRRPEAIAVAWLEDPNRGEPVGKAANPYRHVPWEQFV